MQRNSTLELIQQPICVIQRAPACVAKLSRWITGPLDLHNPMCPTPPVSGGVCVQAGGEGQTAFRNLQETSVDLQQEPVILCHIDK